MTDFSTLDARLGQINQRLKAARLGLQIERRGERLGLRGTLPPRPGSHRLNPHQQRISLNLAATQANLKLAEQEVKVIAARLIEKTFDWKEYLPLTGGGQLRQMDLPQKIQAFGADYLSCGFESSHPASVRTTWEKAYVPYLKKLEAIAQSRPNLSLAEAIYVTVESTPANTRSRQLCCTALGALADFLNIELPKDLKTYWGNYGSSRTQMRTLPSDEEILAAYEQIPSPTWRFVYGIMATYGLRNHEVFFCDYSALESGDDTLIEVLETTKTGTHQVWPFHPEWVDRFDLRAIALPPLNTDLTQTTLQRIGQLVSTQFRRYDIPFSPYDLRHAWAVRTIHIGLPDTVAARMMGHSVAIHTRTYHRWITRRDQQAAVEAALRKVKD